MASGKILALMGRAAIKSLGPDHSASVDESTPLPTTVLETIASPDAAKLEAFHQLTEWRNETFVHPCYLHILAFPSHLELMLQQAFPFKLLGLVHIGNRFTQIRPVRQQELLSERAVKMSCRFGQLLRHDRGWQFEILTEASVNGEVVWQSGSRHLCLCTPKRDKPGEKTSHAPAPQCAEPSVSEEWLLPADLGRHYAAVSGDFNPIHLNAVAARLFGFKRHIVHGLWSKARCISALSTGLPEQYQCEVKFLKPVFLPGQVNFTAGAPDPSDPTNKRSFHLAGSKDGVAHLTGSIFE